MSLSQVLHLKKHIITKIAARQFCYTCSRAFICDHHHCWWESSLKFLNHYYKWVRLTIVRSVYCPCPFWKSRRSMWVFTFCSVYLSVYITLYRYLAYNKILIWTYHLSYSELFSEMKFCLIIESVKHSCLSYE